MSIIQLIIYIFNIILKIVLVYFYYYYYYKEILEDNFCFFNSLEL